MYLKGSPDAAEGIIIALTEGLLRSAGSLDALLLCLSAAAAAALASMSCSSATSAACRGLHFSGGRGKALNSSAGSRCKYQQQEAYYTSLTRERVTNELIEKITLQQQATASR
jgi:hypothetical protein